MPYLPEPDNSKARWHHVLVGVLLLFIAFFGYSNAHVARCMMAGRWHPVAINVAVHDALVASGVFAVLYFAIALVLAGAWWRSKPWVWLLCGLAFLCLLLAEQAVWYFITDHGP
jgi:hypothetical protein